MGMSNKMEYPQIVYIEAALMENGELMHFGKSLGFICKKQKKLVEAEATRLTRGGEVVVVIGDKVA